MPKRDIAGFIAHWSAASPSERANSQAFLIDLCDGLEVPAPDNHPNAGYFFEYPVTERHADGTPSNGRIDLYKRAGFVLESKQFQEAKAEASQLQLAAGGGRSRHPASQPVRGTGAWDDAMIKARGQAERYVRALPTDEPTIRPSSSSWTWGTRSSRSPAFTTCWRNCARLSPPPVAADVSRLKLQRETS